MTLVYEESKTPYCEECRMITLPNTVHYCEDCIKPLLRVARAAEIAWPYMFVDMPKKMNHKRITYEKLYDTLKEVSDLLASE